MKPNVERNRELIKKRLENPLKWSFEELEKLYGRNKKTLYAIFERDVSKYATAEQIRKYRSIVDKKRRGELSPV